jgi:hypothetical protein
LLWGREDKVTTLPFGERLVNELPQAKLIVYPRCGHFPMIEAVRPSTRDLLAFLGEMKAPGAKPVAEKPPTEATPAIEPKETPEPTPGSDTEPRQ